MSINLPAAENKLRQAELLCNHLRSLAGEIALQLRRRGGEDFRLPLETYFSACMGAARSCYFVLARTGGKEFKRVSSHLRNTVLHEEQRARFNSMLNLRDRDVHFGETGATVLPTMMAAQDDGSAQVFYNAAIFGPKPTSEHKNPDGTKVQSSAMHSSVGLYIEIGGRMAEATTVCADFIFQLKSLLDAARAGASST